MPLITVKTAQEIMEIWANELEDRYTVDKKSIAAFKRAMKAANSKTTPETIIMAVEKAMGIWNDCTDEIIVVTQYKLEP